MVARILARNEGDLPRLVALFQLLFVCHKLPPKFSGLKEQLFRYAHDLSPGMVGLACLCRLVS